MEPGALRQLPLTQRIERYLAKKGAKGASYQQIAQGLHEANLVRVNRCCVWLAHRGRLQWITFGYYRLPPQH